MTHRRLELEDLSEEECRKILSRNHFGRLGFSFRDRVDIRPLEFVADDEWIFGRTSAGEKLLTLEHHRWVAFQVDEVTDRLNWTSVLIHGAFHLLEESGSEESARLRERAMRMIQNVDPGAFTSEDDLPERDLLFGIAIQELAGRRARAAGSLP